MSNRGRGRRRKSVQRGGWGGGRHYMMLLVSVSVWCPCNSPKVHVPGQHYQQVKGSEKAETKALVGGSSKSMNIGISAGSFS
jgi:hypothetical protein